MQRQRQRERQRGREAEGRGQEAVGVYLLGVAAKAAATLGSVSSARPLEKKYEASELSGASIKLTRLE